MRRFHLLLLSFFVSTNLLAQRTIDPSNVDVSYLEHLVKIGVDKVRLEHDCVGLVNDSILYIASSHHALYMKEKGRLSHDEVTDSTRTPQIRAEHYGAINYGVGENVLVIPFNTEVVGKKGEKFDARLYSGLADAIVKGWVNSPGHYRNMITPEYQITGLSIAVDYDKGKVYACQKFAKVYYKYQFEEDKGLFPHSTYVPPVEVDSFEGIDDVLLDPYQNDYKLRHDKLENCDKCEEMQKNKPYITLRVERKNFILKIENSEYVKDLIDDRKDGFAVEIVTFDDYMCGNPAYYTRPSRRNGQTKLNGTTLEPLYKKDLLKGYKKRKKRKDVKFLDYIFKADSIAFFKRFGRYRLDKYDFKYFEIKLGKVPKDQEGYWSHNLVYIQKKQICRVDYFTGYCGEFFTDYMPTEFIPASSDGAYTFMPERKELSFTIPFEQGKSTFTREDIAPFTASISDLTYEIDSIHIHAFASVEGDSVINHRLQTQRAENIISLMKKRQSRNFPVKIKTSTDWESFFNIVSKSSRWRSMVNMSKEQIQEKLRTLDDEHLEKNVLSKQRRGEIDMYCTVPVNDNNIEFLIDSEWKRIMDSIYKRKKKNIDYELEKLNQLYGYIHHLVLKNKLTSSFLASKKLPVRYSENHYLAQKFILYGYEYHEEFVKNKQWEENHLKDSEMLIYNCTKHLEPEFVYAVAKFATDNYVKNGVKDAEKVQKTINVLQRLGRYYRSDSVARYNIDRVNFNLNVVLIDKVFQKTPLESSKDALNSIAQLHEFYKRYNMMDGEKSIKLAKCAVSFKGTHQAIRILESQSHDDSVIAYLMPLRYHHSSNDWRDNYYKELIELSESMNTNLWCNMFIRNCGIPFQSLDHEVLRNTFCEKCMNENETVLKLTGRLVSD